ncbi:hypothetical protein GUJ93_ZPchr0458g22517 [Zizania palustris]|uniref:Uncharacterized protein n=1 Tax=Zizania palustris TaxID=103762 RepID=A0A8J5R1T1_ZIZPA|nr:hypothetical protein GUJ93_ZPchr0458g22517 [Zizania palustris]
MYEAFVWRKDEVPGYDDRDASTSAAAPPLGPAQTKRRTPQKKLASKRKKRLAPEGGPPVARTLSSWLNL